MKEKPEHHLLLQWLMLTGIVVFAVIVAWHENLFTILFSVDKSRICWVITLVYLLVTLHCAARVYKISNQTNLSKTTDQIIKNLSALDLEQQLNSKTALPDCYMSDYIQDLYLRNKQQANETATDPTTNLIDIYEARLRRPQEIGWFVSDMLLKLGLLGTIIGFILMLSSVGNIVDFDISSMQKILQHMSNGMGTALYTTLLGLVCSILSAMQYHMLDKHVDELVELIQHSTEIHFIPKMS